MKTLEQRIEELEYKAKIDEINSRGKLKAGFMGSSAYDQWMIEILNARAERDKKLETEAKSQDKG